MKVWRVENAEGRGPYNSEWLFRDMIREAHDNDPLRPCPDGEFQIYTCYWRGLFGFDTYDQLSRWFGEWLDILCECGYYPVQVEAAKIICRSDKQLSFIRANKE